MKKLDGRWEKQNSGPRQGFHSKEMVVGLPSEKSPPMTAKRWAVNAESLPSLASSRTVEAQEGEEDTSELSGLNFNEYALLLAYCSVFYI